MKYIYVCVCVCVCVCVYIYIYMSYYSTTPWRWIFIEKLIVTQLVEEEPAFFMEPEISLPCSQKPATGPHPEPAESSSPHWYLFS
jgi:hypothetical protein